MREEALLGGFEGRARCGLGLRVERAALAGDVGGLQGGVEIVVDDLEGAGIGVVDADLLGRERVLDQLVFDALVGERPGGVEAERLEIAGQHLHGGDAARLDRLHELGARGEGEILAAPEAEPLGVGEIVHGRGARGGDVDDARIRAARAAGATRHGPAGRAPARRARPCRRRHSPWHGFRRTRSLRRIPIPANRRSGWTRETLSSRASVRSVA